VKAIFCEKKNGSNEATLSTKKTAAVVITVLVIIDLVILFFFSPLHWTARLAAAGVPEAVLTALVAGEFALPGWLFKVYKDGKAQGAV